MHKMMCHREGVSRTAIGLALMLEQAMRLVYPESLWHACISANTHLAAYQVAGRGN